MDQLFGSLKGLVKRKACVIDNSVFRLHYRVTFLFLVACSVMVTARQYFGDPIDCISKDDIPSKLLDTYCWIHTTFSVESAFDKKVGVEVPYPGVDKWAAGSSEPRVFHAYYQWVCFVLFFQAVSFYAPHYIWKMAEAQKCRTLMLGLESPIMAAEDRDKKRGIILTYILRHQGMHNFSFYVYCLCEVLNFLNVLLQMYVVDRFLGREFSTYGWKVLQFSEWEYSVRNDPMIRIFPRLTKCTFHRYGASGDVQKHDAMCILPINIINEKIYIFIWFWFYFLLVVSFVAIIYRILTIINVKFRVMAFKSRCRIADDNTMETVASRIKIGDWFMLDLLSKNIDTLNFRDLIVDYYDALSMGRNADDLEMVKENATLLAK
ncbi:Innexin inx2 [Halotydeus destructor]|nr:Innexin inx2 [Halotydeus destructor]